MGLPGMERRAGKLGGSFSVGPAVGGGTLLRLVLPLQTDTLDTGLVHAPDHPGNKSILE